jgi:hypothetical protein
VARFLFNGLLQRRHDVAESLLEDQQAAEEGNKYEAMLRVSSGNSSSSSSSSTLKQLEKQLTAKLRSFCLIRLCCDG